MVIIKTKKKYLKKEGCSLGLTSISCKEASMKFLKHERRSNIDRRKEIRRHVDGRVNDRRKNAAVFLLTANSKGRGRMQKTNNFSRKDLFLSIFYGLTAIAIIWYGSSLFMQMLPLL